MQVEIDEFQDYEKAIGALKEALKYLAKETSNSQSGIARTAMELASTIEHRILLIEKFCEAKRCIRKDPGTAIAICEALLQDPQLDDAVRVGDCMGLLIEHYHRCGQLQEAYQYLREMEERKINARHFVEHEVLEQVYRAVGNTSGASSRAASKLQQNYSEADAKESKQYTAAQANKEDYEHILEEEGDEHQQPAAGMDAIGKKPHFTNSLSSIRGQASFQGKPTSNDERDNEDDGIGEELEEEIGEVIFLY